MRFAIAASVMGLMLGAASAQEADRYTMERTDQGYVRLDTRTGQMSICKENGSQLVCQLAADDRTAFEDEIDRLQGQLDAVERRVAALEANRQPSSGVPSEEEFEKTMSYMQRFFQGFVDIVKELDRDLRGSQPEGPAPDRT